MPLFLSATAPPSLATCATGGRFDALKYCLVAASAIAIFLSPLKSAASREAVGVGAISCDVSSGVLAVVGDCLMCDGGEYDDADFGKLAEVNVVIVCSSEFVQCVVENAASEPSSDRGTLLLGVAFI